MEMDGIRGRRRLRPCDMEDRNINVRGKKRLCLMTQMLGKGATNITKKRVSLTSGH